MTDMILGIHSNVAGDSAGFTAGHAWISITNNGSTTVYGLWPDAHPRTIDNGEKTDIRVGLEASATAVANRYYILTDPQSKHFVALMKANVAWRYTHTCASWASDVVWSVVREDVDADDYFGFKRRANLDKASSI